MPKFAANLSMLYNELPFLDRFEAAARDGFQGVECLFPYAWPVQEMAARLQGNGLRQVLLNAPPGGTDAASSHRWVSHARGPQSLVCATTTITTNEVISIVAVSAAASATSSLPSGLKASE